MTLNIYRTYCSVSQLRWGQHHTSGNMCAPPYVILSVPLSTVYILHIYLLVVVHSLLEVEVNLIRGVVHISRYRRTDVRAS